MSFPEVFQSAQKLGLTYYRIYEPSVLYTGTYPFNVPNGIPVIPWGLAVGPDSDVDSFLYNDWTGSSGPSFGFSVGCPLVNIVPTPGSDTRFISLLRSFPNTVFPQIDIYVFFKPVVNLPPLKRNPKLAMNFSAAYGAGNGVITSGGQAIPFGRRALSLAFLSSSAAILRLDLFTTIYDTFGQSFSVPFFTFTTNNTANDGVQTEIPFPTNAGGITYIVTKISGAAGTTVGRADMID